MGRIRHKDAKQTQYSYGDHLEDFDQYDSEDEYDNSSYDDYIYGKDDRNGLTLGDVDQYLSNPEDNDDSYIDEYANDIDYDTDDKTVNEAQKLNLCLDQLYGMFDSLDIDMATRLLKENNYNVGIVSKYIKCITPTEDKNPVDEISLDQITSHALSISPAEISHESDDNHSDLKQNNPSNTYKELLNKKYSIENEIYKNSQSSGIKPFSFDVLSPDDTIRQARLEGTYVSNNKLGCEDELSILNRDKMTKSSLSTKSKEDKKTSVMDITLEPSLNMNQSEGISSTYVQPSETISTPSPIPDDLYSKPFLTLIIAGHVDAGKSTVTGHLLYNKGIVDEKVIRKYEKQCKEIGKASFQYAWILDEGEEERERGVTIDLGIRYMETEKHMLTLLDAPGHRDFINNMISGAFQSDLAVLIISASKGEFESGSSDQGQTKEHITLFKGIGVEHVIVGINKMDTIDWSEERFHYIQTQLNQIFKLYSFRKANITYVPISGIYGDNLTSKSTYMPWYNGPTLIEAIDSCPDPEYPISQPVRMAISDVYKSESIGPAVAGKILSGTILSKQKYTIIPGMKKVNVKNILVCNKKVHSACAGVTAEIAIDADINTLKPGSVLYDFNTNYKPCKKFQAQVFSLPNLKTPFFKGTTLLLYTHSAVQPVVITRILAELDKSGQELSKKPKFITANKFSLIEFKCDKPLCLEPYSVCSSLGRIMLRDNGITYALGKVSQIFEEQVQKSPRNDNWDDY